MFGEIGAEDNWLRLTALVALGGAAMLTWFIRKAAVGGPPDGGYAPVHPSHNLKRGDDGDDGPDYPVGFELLMARSCWLIPKTPFEAGIFMLPVMVASGFSGPIAGLLLSRQGCARWRPAGCCSAPSAFSAWR